MCAVVTLQVFLETVIYLIWGEADKQPIQLFSYENVLKLADRIKIPPWQNNVKDWKHSYVISCVKWSTTPAPQ